MRERLEISVREREGEKEGEIKREGEILVVR